MGGMSGRFFGNMILGSLWWFNVSIWVSEIQRGIRLPLLPPPPPLESLLPQYIPLLLNFIHISIIGYLMKAA